MLERNRKGINLATENQLASNIHAGDPMCLGFSLHVCIWYFGQLPKQTGKCSLNEGHSIF
jgi:hypothetical protein